MLRTLAAAVVLAATLSACDDSEDRHVDLYQQHRFRRQCRGEHGRQYRRGGDQRAGFSGKLEPAQDSSRCRRFRDERRSSLSGLDGLGMNVEAHDDGQEADDGEGIGPRHLRRARPHRRQCATGSSRSSMPPVSRWCRAAPA